jgi:hypothetical protein
VFDGRVEIVGSEQRGVHGHERSPIRFDRDRETVTLAVALGVWAVAHLPVG